jgi:hypothetical protein
MQKLIIGNDRARFDADVNMALNAGATIVPGTLTVAMTSHRKRGSENNNYLQSRYAIVLETPATLPDPARPEELFPGVPSI